MFEKLNRQRVQGFLRSEGQKMVNGNGDEILLMGWGLGNWLLCEGYMWLSGDPSFNRPRNIEETIRDLTGSVFAEQFWKTFRRNYVTRKDIEKMAGLGYNSVRIPINWRVLMEDEPDEIRFKEEGFSLLDNALAWCEEYKIYAFLDLHGAPGGQTGDNIDDSRDNLPRLFIDRDYWNKGIALWEELARRYKDRWIVGGYDLLNEPLRTERFGSNVDYFLPQLARFYEEVIIKIRNIDKMHLLSLEGHHWATDNAVFWKKYDENSVLHFHRYGCPPEYSSIESYTTLRDKLNIPLWLGETGENNNEWYAALYTLALKMDIGINVWPWKKMECTNSPYSVKKPSNWDAIIDYTKGGPKPTKGESIRILEEYLENMKIENCKENPGVNSALFRRPPVTLRGTDFDSIPGKGESYSGIRDETFFFYRHGSGMAIRVEEGHDPAKDTTWARWGVYELELSDGEFGVYSIHGVEEGTELRLSLVVKESGIISAEQDGELLGAHSVSEGMEVKYLLHPAQESRVKISVKSGRILLKALIFC